MADTKKAVYKRYNGTDWDTIYFETSADKVKAVSYTSNSTTYYKLPLDTQYHTVNNKHFGQTGGITLTDSDINYSKSSSYTPVYITDGATLEATIEALDTAVKTAYDHVPSGCLTSDNYATTLGSVYEAKGTAQTLINGLDVSNISGAGAGKTLSALSETDGKISATFQNISITKSQVSDFPSSMPASDVSSWAKATSKPSYNATEITMSSSDSTTVSEKIQDVMEVANGKTDTIAIHTVLNDINGWKNLTESEVLSATGGSSIINSYFSSSNTTLISSDGGDIIIIAISSSTSEIRGDIPKCVKAVTVGNYTVYYTDPYEYMDVGDVILTVDTDTPDWWLSEMTTGVRFSVLETQKITHAWADITGKPTLSVSGNTVTIGDNSVTALTSSSTLDATKLSGTIPSSCYTNTTYSDATTSAHGLMTSAMVTKLNGITESADSVSFTQTLTSGTAIGTITINGTDTTLYCQTDTDNDKKTSSTASTGAKLYLLGASAQASTGSESKSNVNCYVGTDNCLYSNAKRLPNIFYEDTAPTSGAVTGDICIEY